MNRMNGFILYPLLAIGLLAALGLAFPPLARAAATYQISGDVKSKAGAPIAATTVVIEELNRGANSNSEGHYRIGGVPAGHYTLSVSRLGFKPAVLPVEVSTGDIVQDATLEETPIELPPVQVTATPTPSSPLTSPQPVSLLGQSELRASQAPSVGETISSLPGIHSWSTGTGVGKPIIRGLGSERVLVLQDGLRLDSQEWGDEHSPNVETADADRVEVIKGPSSVLYGSDALGGVVNVIERPLPSAVGGTGFVQGRASGGFATNNEQPDGTLTLEGATGISALRARLSGRDSNDIKTPAGDLNNSGNRAVSGGGELGFNTGVGTFSGSYSLRDERIEIHEDPSEEPDFTGYQKIQTQVASLKANIPAGDGRFEFNGGYTRSKRREFESASSDTVALGLLSHDWIGTLRYHHAPVNRMKGVVGLSGTRNTFDKFGEESLIPASQDVTVGAFGFEQFDLGKTQLSAGLRYDHRNLDVDADQDLGVAAQTRKFDSVTGNVGALYRVAESAALAVNVGRGFRSPSNFDLFANGVHEGTVQFVRGNPDLKNETSVNTDISLRAQSSRVRAEVSGFGNFVQNFIYNQPTGQTDPESGFQIYDTVQGDARLVGFEFGFDYLAMKALHLIGGTDYVRAQNTSLDEPLPFIPPFSANGALRWDFAAKGKVTSPYVQLGVRGTSKQSNPNPLEIDPEVAPMENKGYALLQARAGATVTAGTRKVMLDLTGENLTDQKYVDWMSRYRHYANSPGLNVIFRATMEF